ncbi:MAG: YbhB/YbcL family Raf kinase inhibitor-like protein [Bdellovibrionota bacterium]
MHKIGRLIHLSSISFKLTSNAFENAQPIPKKFTREGNDLSPSLEWSGAPAQTKQFVLVCEDPDAPQDEPWVHWLLYKISPALLGVPEGLPKSKIIQGAETFYQGKNSFGEIGYGGPLPPRGHGWHRYIFRLFAIDVELQEPPGISKQQLFDVMRSHILTYAELVGTYRRESILRSA